MNETKKRLHDGVVRLAESGASLRDLYRAVFDAEGNGDLTMCETVTSVRVRRVTYREVRERIERLAAAIRAHLGDGDRYVALSGESSVEWTVAFWAILRSGNRPCLIGEGYSPEELPSGIDSLDAVGLLALGSDLCESLCAEGETLEALPEDAPFGDAVAVTTASGRPWICTGRSLVLQVKSTLSLAEKTPALLGNGRRGVKHLVLLPLYNALGLTSVYLPFSLVGATFVFTTGNTRDALLHAARRTDVTHVFAPPCFWHAVEGSVLRELSQRDEGEAKRLRRALASSVGLQRRLGAFGRRIAVRKLRDLRARLLPDSVSCCVSVGGHLYPSSARLLNALGYPLVNAYGTTELGIASIGLSGRIDDRLCGSVGAPLPSVEYRISDAGHLLVRSPSLSDALRANGEASTVDGFLDTGDLAHVEADGSYVIEGRASECVTLDGGECVSLDRIEEHFVLPSAVALTVLSDRENGRPMLLTEIPEELSESAVEAIGREIDALNATLPPELQVGEVRYTRDALMREGDLRVDRAYVGRALAEGEIRLCDTAEGFSGGASAIRERIRRIFAEVLGIDADAVTGDAHFMIDLGGSSLDYFTMIGELDRAFGIRLPYESESSGYSLDDFERLVKEQLNCHV